MLICNLKFQTPTKSIMDHKLTHDYHLKACIRASVLFISRLYISEADMTVNGVSEPKDWAMAIAMAVLPKRK